MANIIKSIVKGYKEELVNYFVEKEGNRLAILFPGVGYNNDMPLQYYSSKILSEKGYNILKVNYRYNDNEEFHQAPIEEKRKWIRCDVVSSIDSIIKERDFEEIILVCKSIGTIAGIESLKTIKKLRNAKIIWLTPLCHIDEFVNELKEITNQSLIVIGTNDPCYVKENLEQIGMKENYENLIIPEVDHSLELTGNIRNSVQIMDGILKGIQKFIDTSR